MANGRLLRKLVKTGASGDTEAFKRVSEEVIQDERHKQHHLLANDLEKILYGEPRPQNVFAPSLERVPHDSERNLPLIEVKEPVRRLEDVVLSSDNKRIIDDVLTEYHRIDLLGSYGMRPIEKLLFFGPPGCGKTLTSEVIASELGRPFAVVRMDNLVSSYLGETAASLGKVFDFISSNQLVVLFDEFDLLAKERGDPLEHGELKRVVNALLQMMDRYRGKSLVVAATNHESLLDYAIWRRFDEVLLFDKPNNEQLASLLRVKLRGVRRDFDISDSAILNRFSELSHADVERILRRAIKGMLLEGKEFLAADHIDVAIDKESGRRQHLFGSEA